MGLCRDGSVKDKHPSCAAEVRGAPNRFRTCIDLTPLLCSLRSSFSLASPFYPYLSFCDMLTFLLLMGLRVIAYHEHHDALCVGDVWINDASTLRSGPRAGFHIGRFLAFGAVFAKLASCLALAVILVDVNQFPTPNTAHINDMPVMLSDPPPYGVWYIRSPWS